MRARVADHRFPQPWPAVCPVKILKDPEVRGYLRLWSNCRTWQSLPRAGGIDDQRNTDMEALDAIERAMAEDLNLKKKDA